MSILEWRQIGQRDEGHRIAIVLNPPQGHVGSVRRFADLIEQAFERQGHATGPGTVNAHCQRVRFVRQLHADRGTDHGRKAAARESTAELHFARREMHSRIGYRTRQKLRKLFGQVGGQPAIYLFIGEQRRPGARIVRVIMQGQYVAFEFLARHFRIRNWGLHSLDVKRRLALQRQEHTDQRQSNQAQPDQAHQHPGSPASAHAVPFPCSGSNVGQSTKRSSPYRFLPDRNTATLSPARSCGVRRVARSVRRRLFT